jgi:hypothetical protein
MNLHVNDMSFSQTTFQLISQENNMKARLKKVTHSNAGFGALALRNPLVLFLQHMARKNYLAHLVDMVSKEPDSGWNQLV